LVQSKQAFRFADCLCRLDLALLRYLSWRGDHLMFNQEGSWGSPVSRAAVRAPRAWDRLDIIDPALAFSQKAMPCSTEFRYYGSMISIYVTCGRKRSATSRKMQLERLIRPGEWEHN